MLAKVLSLALALTLAPVEVVTELPLPLRNIEEVKAAAEAVAPMACLRDGDERSGVQARLKGDLTFFVLINQEGGGDALLVQMSPGHQMPPRYLWRLKATKDGQLAVLSRGPYDANVHGDGP